jgi:hypothetical protein
LYQLYLHRNNGGFFGFNPTIKADNLNVTVDDNGDVNLTWLEPANMGVGDWYEVYYSFTRDGFFGTLNVSYFLVFPAMYFGNNTANHTNAQADNPGSRLYYMIVPFNSLGIRGASTYSIGVWTEEYLSQYDSFGIPLKPSINQVADWYCDNIPYAVGINYFNITAQRWCWHSTMMSKGAYDPELVMSEGFQLSTSNTTKFTFIGI